MKVAVIGCTHAGTAAIVQTAKRYPEAQITVYERNDNISFLSCGIALYVGGVVKDPQGLFYSSPNQLADLGVVTKMRHDVLDVDTANKTLRVRDLGTGEEIEDTFDKLIITTGSWPVVPPFEGIDLDNIMLCKNYNHSNAIIEKARDARRVVVIGAGYIGIELVEAFEENGKEVTLIDMSDRVMSKYLDAEFTAPVEETLRAKGVRLALGETVARFEGSGGRVSKVVTNQGEYEADLVILCIGFKPSTELFRGQLDMLDNGAIVVDEYMRASQPDVFAAGDCCAVQYNPTGQAAYIPLATNAVRMGTIAACNLVEPRIRSLGTQGTSGIKIYDHHIASTGLTEQAALAAGMNVKVNTITDSYRPEFMPTHEEVMLKVVYEADGGRIVGAQLASKIDLTAAVNTLSLSIQNKMTMDELAVVDFFFQPHFNKPWNFLNTVGLQTLARV
ncbi:FAD-dependent oxidoreductase [Paenibacillus apiarius]|uniref:FAD-dependent oxidoreductase n=1 Tax=Paenibacillus apiarius TaxID=46240 RepID=A0ABT4DS63_9BACL|nr:FAD-dependent oxidoreductase [Paenibacillus apiarius]MCY9515457.1 FAD-dependent oxidoreductase [Paenibacillus apiarius]MCY9518866.1 FAD-dependent oxidoreductase [Paenibacillus apiarius]MCY9552087.1 FAD-dependent oxidoreductase [Paenibacillus apiarius]MCY9557237.1 FAD-dependent oxidoreductase [Paenibacillus apiarius]MCY9682585.1 FAD-dependent oxidoreductase [Paenibacillus apiarius]